MLYFTCGVDMRRNLMSIIAEMCLFLSRWKVTGPLLFVRRPGPPCRSSTNGG
jgi:hypothetical protein